MNRLYESSIVDEPDKDDGRDFDGPDATDEEDVFPDCPDSIAFMEEQMMDYANSPELW